MTGLWAIYSIARWLWSFCRSHARGGRTIQGPRSGLVRIWEDRVTPALSSILVDFHETQALFVITIQVASLMIFNNASLAFQDFSDAAFNTMVVRRISVDGALAVLLGQALLQLAGKHQWFPAALNTIAFALSVACQELVTSPSYAQLWDKLRTTVPVAQCGGNPSPASYCWGSYRDEKGVPKEIHGNGIDEFLVAQVTDISVRSCILAILLADQAWVNLRRARHPWQVRVEVSLERFHGFLRWTMRLVWAALAAGLSTLLLSYYLDLLRILQKYSLSGQWSFGQLVAAMIWAPVGLKFLNYIFCELAPCPFPSRPCQPVPPSKSRPMLMSCFTTTSRSEAGG